MLSSFDEMPINSRIWIYQTDRIFTPAEKAIVEERIGSFMNTWASHGKPLKASFKLFFDRFIIIAVDESYYSASGCSIDSSVEVIRVLEKELDIQLLDRSNIAYKRDGEIALSNIGNLKEDVRTGKIAPETLVFNNTITTLAELEEKWQMPASATWIARYFPAEAN